MSSLFLYVLIKLDSIIYLSWLLFWVFLLLPLVFSGVTWLKEPQGSEKDYKVVFKKLRKFIYWSLFACFVGTLLPSTKEMAVIYVVPKITNSIAVKELPKKLLNLSSEWLDELRPEKIKESGKTIVQQSLTSSEDSAQISGETSVSE